MKRSRLDRRTPLDSSGTLERRTPLAKGKGLKRAGRVKPKRDKPRRGRLVLPPPERQRLRHEVYDRAGGRCEAGVVDECPGRLDRDAFEWHHRKLRSQGGDDVHENSLCLCTYCHAWAHANPADARGLGLIVPRGANPAERAVHLADGRVVRLTSENTYDLVFPATREGDAA